MEKEFTSLDALRCVSRFLSKTVNEKPKAMIAEENPIKSLRVDYLVHFDYGKSHKVFIVSKISQNELLSYNSQFTKEYSTKFFVDTQIALTEVHCKGLKRVLIIKNRTRIKRIKGLEWLQM